MAPVNAARGKRKANTLGSKPRKDSQVNVDTLFTDEGVCEAAAAFIAKLKSYCSLQSFIYMISSVLWALHCRKTAHAVFCKVTK